MRHARHLRFVCRAGRSKQASDVINSHCIVHTLILLLCCMQLLSHGRAHHVRVSCSLRMVMVDEDGTSQHFWSLLEIHASVPATLPS